MVGTARFELARWCKPKTYLFPSRDPRRGPEQSRQRRLARLSGGGSPGWTEEANHPTHSASQLGNTPVRGWHRPAHHPGFAWSWWLGDYRSGSASLAAARHLQAVTNPRESLSLSSAQSISGTF